MITEFLVKVAVGLFEFFAGLFPDWDVPPELLDADGMIGGIISLGTGLEPFVNWGFVSAIAMIPLVVWVIGITVRAVRLLMGHVPGIGGNG